RSGKHSRATPRCALDRRRRLHRPQSRSRLKIAIGVRAARIHRRSVCCVSFMKPASSLEELMATIIRNWLAPVVRGVLAIIFGILALAKPGPSLLAILILFAAFAFVEGIVNIAGALHRAGQERWWVHLIQGLVSIAIAVIAIAWPGITALALVYCI